MLKDSCHGFLPMSEVVLCFQSPEERERREKEKMGDVLGGGDGTQTFYAFQFL